MEILLAKSAGFCFGVQRAVDTAYEHADEENVYTYGQIIHRWLVTLQSTECR